MGQESNHSHLPYSDVEDEERRADHRHRAQPQNPAQTLDEQEQSLTLDPVVEPFLQLLEPDEQLSGAHDVEDDERDCDAAKVGDEGRPELVRLPDDV